MSKHELHSVTMFSIISANDVVSMTFSFHNNLA